MWWIGSSRRTSRERTFSIDAPDLQDLMSLEDLHKLRTLAKEATPEDPERSMDVYLTVRLTRCLFRLTARVIWSHGADPQPLSVNVQFSDLKGEAVLPGYAVTADAGRRLQYS